MQKIICLTEETTEWLYLLGEQERIAGISAYTVRPPQARRDKPVVSAFISGSISKIKALAPDLVIGFSDIQAELAKSLIQAGLNVLIFNQRSLAEILENLQVIANLVDQSQRGAELIAEMQSTIDLARAQSHLQSRKPRIFFQEWDEPIISGIRWVSELIEIAGGEDCFAEKAQGGLAKERILTAAEVAQKNPDLIVGSWCGKPVNFDWVKNHPEWQGVAAIRSGAIVEMDPSIILQPGPALFLAGLPELQKIIESHLKQNLS